MNQAVRRLVGRVSGDADALVGGTPEMADLIFNAAAADLAGDAAVIRVASPAAELTLSSLISQISGCTDIGGQDDSALELGFKRLTGPGRTVLFIAAPLGISRSALRYLQHNTGQAPRLRLVLLASAPLEALLDDPGLAALRTRLRANPVISANLLPMVVTTPPILPVRRRRSLAWLAMAAGVAVVAGIAWVGTTRATADASRPSQRVSVAAVPLELAQVPAAALARSEPPAVIARAPPSPLVPQTPIRPVLVSAAVLLPPLLPPPPALRTSRPAPPRHELVRIVRPAPRWQPRPSDNPADYAWDSPPPAWRRPYVRRMSPYFGPDAIDEYGRTMFGYTP